VDFHQVKRSGFGQKKNSQSANAEQRQWHKSDSVTDRKKSHLILSHNSHKITLQDANAGCKSRQGYSAKAVNKTKGEEEK
jgi:hypothetical protein